MIDYIILFKYVFYLEMLLSFLIQSDEFETFNL